MISRKNPKNRKLPLYLILPLILPSILISLIKQYWNRYNLPQSLNNTETGTTYLTHQTILKQVQLTSVIKQYWNRYNLFHSSIQYWNRYNLSHSSNNTETGTTYLSHQTILKQVQLISLINTVLKQVKLISLIKQYWNRYNLSYSLNNTETGTAAVDLQDLKVEVAE